MVSTAVNMSCSFQTCCENSFGITHALLAESQTDNQWWGYTICILNQIQLGFQLECDEMYGAWRILEKYKKKLVEKSERKSQT